jgi:hypothetical protein
MLMSILYRCAMMLIRGNNCLFSCPVCLVPKDKLSDMRREWPQHTIEQSKAAVLGSSKIGEINKATKDLGLRPI